METGMGAELTRRSLMQTRSRCRRALQHVICALGLLLAGSLTQAQDAPAARADAEYQGLIDDGLRAYGNKRYAEARELFARAHAMTPSARTLRALGIADLALDNFTLAKDELQASLVNRSSPLTPEQRKEVSDLLAWMHANLGTVQLQCTPVHAEAKIDGRKVASPEILLAPEEHELAVSAPGYAPDVRKFQVTLAQPVRLHVELVSAQPSGAVARAAQPEAPAPPPRDAPPQDEPSRAWLWLGGSGAVLAAAGGTLLILGLNDKARVEDAPAGVRLSEIEAAHDRVPWLTGGGIALTALGVGGLGAAAILLLTQGPRRADVARHVHVAPGGAGLRVQF